MQGGPSAILIQRLTLVSTCPQLALTTLDVISAGRRFGALGSADLSWVAVEHLSTERGGSRVCIGVRIGITATVAAVRRRGDMRRRLPADVAHVRAAASAARARVLLDTRLQRRRRSVAGGMRGGPHAGVVTARGCGRRATHVHVPLEMDRKRAVAHVLKLRVGTVHTVGTWRHRKGSLARRRRGQR